MKQLIEDEHICWFDDFITTSTEYVLIDGDGGIRASAFNLDGIYHARLKHGWGTIHAAKFDGKKLVIGKMVR